MTSRRPTTTSGSGHDKVETRVSRLAVNDGDRQLRRTSTRFGEELREIRLRAGVSQSAVAQTIDVSRSVICRIEQGDPNVSSRIRARVAAALGAEFRIAVYPSNAPLIHDAAHARIVEAVLRRCHPTWRATVEAPVPGPGRRSTDMRLDRRNDVVLMEVETRIGAFEAILREVAEKRRAVAEVTPGKRIHVVLVLPPTRHHRDLVASHPTHRRDGISRAGRERGERRRNSRSCVARRRDPRGSSGAATGTRP